MKYYNYNERLRFPALIIFGIFLNISACSSFKNLMDREQQDDQVEVSAEVQAQFNNAVQAMAKEDYPTALKLLRAIQAQHPHLSGPWLNEGIILTKQGQCENAIKVLGKAIAANAENKYAYNQMGICMREMGQFHQAREVYLKAIALDSSYAAALFNLAILEELYLQDLPAALAHFQAYQALQENPDKQVSGWIKDIQRRLPEKPVEKTEAQAVEDTAPANEELAEKPQGQTVDAQPMEQNSSTDSAGQPQPHQAGEDPADETTEDGLLKAEETEKESKPKRSSLWRIL